MLDKLCDWVKVGHLNVLSVDIVCDTSILPTTSHWVRLPAQSFRQKSDTGIKLKLFQDFIFIALDIFRESQHNVGIGNKLEAWLTFLGMDSPEDIVRLPEGYPEYKPLYQEVYAMCSNLRRGRNE